MKEGRRERVHASIHLIHFPNDIMVGTGPGQSQELGTPSGLIGWQRAFTQVPEQECEVEVEEQALNQYSDIQCQCSKQLTLLCHNACSISAFLEWALLVILLNYFPLNSSIKCVF